MGISVNGIPVLGIPGIGVPPGGTENQVLAKKSDANYDTEWVDQTGIADITVATEEKIGGVLSSSEKGELSVSESGTSIINDNVTMEQSAEIVSLEESLGEGPYKLLFDFDEEKIPGDLDQMRQDIDKNTANIQSNTDDIEKNTTNISNNASDIKANSSNIEVIQSRLVYYSNPNLFDNWYFINPINQNGITNYPDNLTTRTYVIDRWCSRYTTVQIDDNGINVNATTASQSYFSQFFETNYNKQMIGRTFTVSVLHDENILYSFTFTPNDITTDIYGPIESGIQFAYDAKNSAFAFNIKSGPITFIAAKLEIGDKQTLAHQDSNGVWILNDAPPNYVDELLKCQRYYYVIKAFERYGTIANFVGWENESSEAIIVFPISMWKSPSINYNNASLRIINITKHSIITVYSSMGILHFSGDRIQLSIAGVTGVARGDVGWVDFSTATSWLAFDAQI